MASLANYEKKVISAHTKLSNYNKNKKGPDAELYKSAFMNECGNSMCDDAVANLVSAIDGQSGLLGCDMLSILYVGDTRGEFHLGWRDIVTTKAAYLLTLVTSGLTS
jgi:hypothetical protein